MLLQGGERWPEEELAALGFSKPAAASFAAITELAMTLSVPEPSATTRGATSLEACVVELVERRR